MTCGTSSAQTRDDARVNEEREEAQVMIACGFDVHRAQITFDLVDHETGELRRGRISPATRERLRVWRGQCESECRKRDEDQRELYDASDKDRLAGSVL